MKTITNSFLSLVKNTQDQDLEYLKKGNNWEEIEKTLDKLWRIYSSYIDVKKFTKDNKNFHAIFWEMYLGCALLENNFSLNRKKEKGPDICLENPRIWIEATTSTDGEINKTIDSNYSKNLVTNFLPQTGFFGVDENKLLLRFLTSIDTKLRKYQDYFQDGTTNLSEFCVIALNGYKTSKSLFDNQAIDGMIPTILKALFPVGDMHEFRPNIKNTNGVSIPTGIFLDEGNSNISGLLYSKVGLQYLYSFPNRKLAEEFIFIHNPLATNKLPRPWLKVGQEYWIDDDNEWLIKFNHEKGIEEKRFKVYLVNETWNLIDMDTNTDY